MTCRTLKSRSRALSKGFGGCEEVTIEEAASGVKRQRPEETVRKWRTTQPLFKNQFCVKQRGGVALKRVG